MFQCTGRTFTKFDTLSLISLDIKTTGKGKDLSDFNKGPIAMARRLGKSLKEHISRLHSKEPSNWDGLRNANALQTPRPSKAAFELGHN